MNLKLIGVMAIAILGGSQVAGAADRWICAAKGIQRFGACDLPYGCIPYEVRADGDSRPAAEREALSKCESVSAASNCQVGLCDRTELPAPIDTPEKKSKVKITKADIVLGAPPLPGGGLPQAQTYFKYADAKAHCEGLGKRLPTARELAEFSLDRGSKIRETNFPNLVWRDPALLEEIRFQQRVGFSPIYRKTADGKVAVDFYYNYRDYRGLPTCWKCNPEGEYWAAYFWTSDEEPDTLFGGGFDTPHKRQYYWGGGGGNITKERVDRSGAAICVKEVQQ